MKGIRSPEKNDVVGFNRLRPAAQVIRGWEQRYKGTILSIGENRMHIILGIFLIAHGVAHLVGFLTYWKIASFEEMPYKTTLLSGLLDVGDVGIRIVGILWLLAGLAFAIVGVGIITL